MSSDHDSSDDPRRDDDGSRSLGSILREQRSALSYSLRKVQELTELLGDRIEAGHLGRIERDEVIPSSAKLVTLCRVLGLSLDAVAALWRAPLGELPRVPEDVAASDLYQQGVTAAKRGRNEEAFRLFLCTLRRQPTGCDESGRVRTLIALATASVRLSLHKLAESYVDDAFAMLSDTLPPEIHLRAHLVAATVHSMCGRNVLAVLLAERSVALARELDDQQRLAVAQFNQATYSFRLGRYRDALRLFSDSRREFERGEPQFAVLSQAFRGASHVRLGRRNTGLKEHLASIEKAKELSRSPGGRLLLAKARHACADSLYFAGDERARRFYRLSRSLYAELREYDYQFAATFRLYRIYKNDGEHRRAARLWSELRSLFRHVNPASRGTGDDVRLFLQEVTS